MAKHKKDADDTRDDELEDDFDSDDDGDGDFSDSGLDIGDDEVSLDDADADADDDDEDVVRPAPKRRAPTKAVPMIEGVPKTKLEKPEICAEVWEKLSQRLVDQPQIPYTIQTPLVANALINHKTFGLGFVVDITSPTRAEVLFQDTLRKLVHSR